MPPDVDLWLIDVREGRDVSQALATRVGVHHESPQVLLVDRGEVVWHATHYRITAREVRARFDEASHRPSAVSSPA